jgi:FAD/FMN-containing dehydrogenase
MAVTADRAALQRLRANRKRRKASDGALEADLRESVRGDVRFDEAYRAAYSMDSSNYRQAPVGVVCPRDADDVVAAVTTCARHDAPMTFRGAGTSLAGQTTKRR